MWMDPVSMPEESVSILEEWVSLPEVAQGLCISMPEECFSMQEQPFNAERVQCRRICHPRRTPILEGPVSGGVCFDAGGCVSMLDGEGQRQRISMSNSCIEDATGPRRAQESGLSRDRAPKTSDRDQDLRTCGWSYYV